MTVVVYEGKRLESVEDAVRAAVDAIVTGEQLSLVWVKLAWENKYTYQLQLNTSTRFSDPLSSQAQYDLVVAACKAASGHYRFAR